jgi:putative transposase
MARRLRVEFPGAIYHLLSRGDRREPIFYDDADRDNFVATMAEACAKTEWQIHAFCLMPNHFHLVLETPQPNLVAGMKWLLGTYTARFNRQHKITGHLFSGRYKSLMVGGLGGYLSKVCEYVHLNPVRANLLQTHQPLRSFLWSSFPDYLETPSERPSWLRVDRVFGESGIPADTYAGRSEFERRTEGLRRHESEAGFEAIRHGWSFGDDQFRKELLAQVTIKAGVHHYGAEIRESAEAKAYGIIERELKRLSLSEQDLKQARRGDPRKVEIAQKLRAQTTMTLNWIAERLHMGTRGYLAHLLYWRGRRSREEVTARTVSTQTAALAPDPLSAGPAQFDPSFD